MLSKIKGKDITEKIQFLKDKGIIERDKEDTKENIIKTNKKVRDVLAHRLDVNPDASYTISLLGDCVNIMKIYEKFIQFKN